MSLLADFHVSVIHNLGDDVRAVAELVADRIRLAIFQFVNGKLLRGRRLDVGELGIVVDGFDVERLIVAVDVVELQGFDGIVALELLYLPAGFQLRRLCLCFENLHLGGRHELRGRTDGRQHRGIARLDHDFQVRIALPDIIQREGVDVALVGDQIEVGMNPGLGRMQETVVLHRLDDPEIFIAGRGFHDLLPRWDLDQRGVAHLGADGDDVVGVVVDDAGRAVGES